MKTGGGGLKGAKWERFCCKRLSLWVTTGKRDDVFWRTAMSGGRATFQLTQDILNRAQAGDMTAISSEGLDLCERHLFEMKHRHNLNFTAFLTNSGGLLTGFWQSTQKAAERLDKLPVLIAKQDRYPAVVFSPIGATLFAPYEPWVVFHRLKAQLHDFETVTAVFRPTIKRPRANGYDQTTAQTRDDERPVFHQRHRGPAA